MKTPPVFLRQKARQTEKPAPKAWPIVSVAAFLGLFFSLATYFLTLVAYGHEAAFLERIGLRPEDLQYAPVDFLMRSWRPVLAWISSSNKVFTWEHFWSLLKLISYYAWLPLLILAIFFMVVDWARKYPEITAIPSKRMESGSIDTAR